MKELEFDLPPIEKQRELAELLWAANDLKESYKKLIVATDEMLKTLIANGQIATQYVDLDGNATNDIDFNPNNSMLAIEGITSPDGRVFGKMAHSERTSAFTYKNVPGIDEQLIFKGAVDYFKK